MQHIICIFFLTKILREGDVEVKIEKAPEFSLVLMIAAMITIELHEKAWLVLVDQLLIIFMSQISVKMMVTHN